MTKIHLFKFLAIITLIVFATSCRQPHTAQVEEDSDVIEKILKVGTLHQTAPDSAHIMLDAIWAENEYRMTNNEKVTFYNARGLAYMTARNFEAAEASLLNALQHIDNSNLHRQAQVMMNAGNIRIQMGALQEALDMFRQARTLFDTDHNDTVLLVRLYLSKGQTFSLIGEVDSSLYYTQSALDIAVEKDNSLWEAQALMNLSNIFRNLEQFSQVEETLQRAITILTEINDQRNLRVAYGNLSLALVKQNRIEEGLFYAQKANELAAAMGIPQTAMFAYYGHRGQIYLEEGSYRNSLAMFYQALELRAKLRDARGIATLENVLAAVYSRLGYFDQALLYAGRALNAAQENGVTRLEAEVQRNLIAIHAARGDMDGIRTAMEAEGKLRDKIFSEQNARALHEMQVRYEVRERELVIAQQKEAIRQQYIRNILLTIVIIVIIILFAVIVFFQRRKVQNITHIVQQYEALAKLKKESDLEKTAKKANDASEKLLQDLLHLFESEKIYRRQGLDLAAVTEMLNSNRSYLSYAISQSKHKNFTEFVNSYRIEEAVELIKEQDKGGKYASYTIQAIAEMVGFNSPSSFYAAFKQVVGVTPMEYKKSMKILNS